jgi:hypothetical protein
VNIQTQWVVTSGKQTNKPIPEYKFKGDINKEDEMGGTCSIFGTDEIYQRFSWGKLNEGISWKVKLK